MEEQRYLNLAGLPVHPWTFELSRVISRQYSSWSLPAAGSRLLLVSDYSAGGTNSQFECYGFFAVADEGYLHWLDRMSWIRARTGLGRRSIQYKLLSDKVREFALPYYLESMQLLRGLLVVFAVDKRIKNILGWPMSEYKWLPKECREAWKPRLAERAIRIACFGGSVLSIAAKPAQDIRWCSDHDEAFDSPERLRHFIELFSPFSSHDLIFKPGDIGFCPISMRLSDKEELQSLLSLPDLACGAMCDGFNSLRATTDVLSTEVLVPLSMNKKALYLHQWFSVRSRNLHKISIMLSPSKKSGYLVAYSMEPGVMACSDQQLSLVVPRKPRIVRI